MTMTEERVPAFLDVSGSEFNDHPGRLLAEVAAGAVVRVTDRKLGIVRGYLTRELPAGLQPVADLIPEPVRQNGLPPAPDGFKRCSACHEAKPATTDEFYRNRSNADGLMDSCKPCKNASNAASHKRCRDKAALAADSETTR